MSFLEFLMYAENLAKMSMPAVLASGCLGASLGYLETKWRNLKLTSTRLPITTHVFQCVLAYRGGVSFSSKNSSILLTSTLTSPLKVTKGGLVPGARLWRSAGFLITQKSGACGHSHVYHSHCMNTCMRLHHVTA